MRDLLFPTWALLQPLIKSLANNNTTTLLLHRCPHPAILSQRVIATINRSHERTIVRLAFCPEWDEAPFHSLQFICDIASMLYLRLLVLLRLLICSFLFLGRVLAVARQIGTVDSAIIARSEVVCLSHFIVPRSFIDLHSLIL